VEGNKPITVAALSKALKYLRSLESWDRGFESHLRHGCLYAFILCLCRPVFAGSGLLTVKGQETEKRPRSNKEV
jgi:hypothetical protein